MKKLIPLLIIFLSGCYPLLAPRGQVKTLNQYLDPLLNTQAKPVILKEFGLPTNTQVVAGVEVWEYYQNLGVTQITNGSSYQAGVFNNGMSYSIPVQHFKHFLFYFDTNETLTYWKYNGR